MTPKFVSIRCNTRSKSSLSALKTARIVWMKEEIKVHYRTLNTVNSRLKYLYLTLTFLFSFIEFVFLDSKFRDEVELFASSTFQRLSKKLYNLKRSQQQFVRANDSREFGRSTFSFHKRFLNLSNVEFSPGEEHLLNYNLKFNFSHNINLNTKEVLAIEAENIIQTTDICNKNIMRARIINFLNNGIPQNRFGDNYSRANLKSLKNKIKTNDLIVTKADKGSCLVIMNRVDYINKVMNFLDCDEFENINRDPTLPFFSKLKGVLDRTLITLEYFNSSKDKLYPMNPRTPLLYGLPKVHKDGMPIRPVVSFVDSPCYHLSSWLNHVLKVATGFHSTYATKNSVAFADYLKNIVIPHNAILVSLDVKNLFPSVPPDDCIKLVGNLLTNNNVSQVLISDLKLLLRTVLDQNFFQFNGKFFRQRSGLAMGSCLSPFLSEVFMNHLEEIIMKSRFANFLTAYKRYVDDVCIVWSGSERDLADFLLFVNTLHERITFTMEREVEGQLPFLDLLLTRNNNSISFDIYRKPTSTDNVIQYSSNSPFSHKFSAFNSLFYRLFKIPLSRDAFNKELTIIKEIAINNGFPLSSINKIYFKFLNKFKFSYNVIHAKQTLNKYRCVSFFGNISLQLAKFFKGFNISIAFRTVNTLKKHLVNTKDRVDQFSKSGVYSLFCDDCPAVYVGQSGRRISTRVREHVSLFNKYKDSDITETKSAFATHLLTSGHNFSAPENVTILHECAKGKKLDLLEKMEITKAKKSPVLTCVNDVFNFEPHLIFNNINN